MVMITLNRHGSSLNMVNDCRLVFVFETTINDQSINQSIKILIPHIDNEVQDIEN